MNEDVLNAVVNDRALRELKRRRSVAATVSTPAEPQANAPIGAVAHFTDEMGRTREIVQARAAYAAAEATVAASRAEQPSVFKMHVRLKKEATVRGVLLLGLQALEALHAEPMSSNMTSRVHRYAMRSEPAGTFCLMPHHSATAQVGAFALAALMEPEPLDASVSFCRVESVEHYDARALRLFAELQNGAALGRASAHRLRELQVAAREEGEALSLDALEALVAFAGEYPEMVTPDLTLAADGAIMAEWRRRKASVTLLFASPASVQYLVKRGNPRHAGFNERFSGTTTVDLVGERLQALLPLAAWPIRA